MHVSTEIGARPSVSNQPDVSNTRHYAGSQLGAHKLLLLYDLTLDYCRKFYPLSEAAGTSR